MSPAMAHRTPEQSRLIEGMSRGLLALAVYPHYPNQLSRGASVTTLGVVTDNSAGALVWEALTTAEVSAEDTNTADADEPQEDAPAIEPIPVSDWDEIIPPDGYIRPPKGSALHRKFSGIGIAGRGGSSASSNAAAADPYFQKFLDAAAAESAGSGKAASRGNVPNLIMTGTAIGEATIAVIDSLCVGYDQLRALQRLVWLLLTLLICVITLVCFVISVQVVAQERN